MSPTGLCERVLAHTLDRAAGEKTWCTWKKTKVFAQKVEGARLGGGSCVLATTGYKYISMVWTCTAGICGGDYGRAPVLRKPLLGRAGGKAQAASQREQKMGSHKKERRREIKKYKPEDAI